MYNDGGTMVVRKRLSFLSVLALSSAAVITTAIVSASGIAIYGLSVIDDKSEDVVAFLGDAVRGLPELRKSLPPALADAWNDERQPDYLEMLTISVRATGEDHRGRSRAVVEVANNGREVVSLLSMRIVGLDEDQDAIFERNTWVATPLQIEDEWRGPLLPGETRRIPIRLWRGSDSLASFSHEVTDIRIWLGPAETESMDTAVADSGF